MTETVGVAVGTDFDSAAFAPLAEVDNFAGDAFGVASELAGVLTNVWRGGVTD